MRTLDAVKTPHRSRVKLEDTGQRVALSSAEALFLALFKMAWASVPQLSSALQYGSIASLVRDGAASFVFGRICFLI